MRSVPGLLIITCCCSPALAEKGSRDWWPFGRKEEPTQLPSVTATPASPPRVATALTPKTSSATAPQIAARPTTQDLPTSIDPDGGWSLPHPSWPAVHLPEVSMPKMPGAKLFAKEEEQVQGNRWHQPQSEPQLPSAWDSVKGGARRMRQGTRSAWDKTVDVLTPGKSDRDVPIARREPPKPPFWKRMFGVAEEPQEGPRTVTEWMAQDRLNP